MQNLRDKLLKAGLVTTDQAKQAEEAKAKKAARPPPPQQRPQQQRERAPDRPERGEARIPKLPPLPGSREHQRLLSKKQLETDRKIRELVVAAQVAVEAGDQTFYFVTRKGRLRRLELTAAQRERLEKGELAVVERPDPAQIEHALVLPETANQLLALSEKAVRFFNKPGSAVGFMTDDELKDRQAVEATLPADTDQRDEGRDASEADAAGAESESESEAEPESEPGPQGSPG